MLEMLDCEQATCQRSNWSIDRSGESITCGEASDCTWCFWSYSGRDVHMKHEETCLCVIVRIMWQDPGFWSCSSRLKSPFYWRLTASFNIYKDLRHDCRRLPAARSCSALSDASCLHGVMNRGQTVHVFSERLSPAGEHWDAHSDVD